MSPLTKGISSLVILIAIMVAGFVFAMRSCLSKYDERMAFPPALYFKQDTTAVLVSLIKYAKATSYSGGQGFVRKTVSNYYYIQSNDAVTGNKISAKEIATEVKHFPEKILGAAGRNAWIFLNELTAFDAFTLQKVADVQIIETKNPVLSGLMPDDAQYYRFDEKLKAIVFTSNDGAQWQLNSETFMATPYQKMVEPVAKNLADRVAQQYQDRLKQLTEINVHFTQLKINQDTIAGKWLGLYSQEEIKNFNPVLSFSPANQQEQRRQFYTASYTPVSPDRFNVTEPFLPKNTATVFYLDAGFLADKETAKALHLSNPAGYLLIYKTLIGEAGEIILSRISVDGAVLWKLNTGLKKWVDYQYKYNRLFIFGNDNKKLSGSYCNLFLSVDLQTAAVNKYDYFTDAIRS